MKMKNVYMYFFNIYMRDQNDFTSIMIKWSNEFMLTFPWIYPV